MNQAIEPAAGDRRRIDAPPALTPEAEMPVVDEGLAPDAAARDAAKREALGEPDPAISEDEFTFVTRGVSDEERAAVIAVLAQTRAEETQLVRRVARRERNPWARSQRVPEGIADILSEHTNGG